VLLQAKYVIPRACFRVYFWTEVAVTLSLLHGCISQERCVFVGAGRCAILQQPGTFFQAFQEVKG
jgi:hypothetical protein